MTPWKPDIAELTGPRYLAIAAAIARDVASGVLAEGTQLPTHRDLAEYLGVTVGTVTRGYAEAERRGLTVGEVGRGTFVRTAAAPRPGFHWPDAARERGTAGVVDMSLALPWLPPDGEEGRLMATTLAEIAAGERPLDELMVYNPASALRRHRQVAARWIGTQGIEVDPEQVIVTSGAQHAIIVILAALLQPGDTLLTEELTYPGVKAVAQMLGLQLRGVTLDHEGIVPEALEAACNEQPARALYLVPTVQNPTGVTMSERRRRQVADVAEAHRLLILEDEIHVATRHDPIAPIARFAPDSTLHVTTLCKWATFGLRVGFVAAPEALVERIRSGVRSSQWMTAPLMVEVATRWIDDGTAERLARRKLAELQERYRIVDAVLGKGRTERSGLLDRGDSRGPAGAASAYDVNPNSLHIWLCLPAGVRSDEFVARARQRGVLVAGAEAFAVGREVPAAVRVSIAAVPERAELRRGLEVLAELLSGDLDPCVDIL
jgi:DNA-binding transcriptional MocR family regulator